MKHDTWIQKVKSENPKPRALSDLEVDGRIILKRMLKREDVWCIVCI